MSDTVIKVENVSKLYRLGEVGTGTISHDLNRWWHKFRGKEDPYLKIGQTNDRSKKGDSDYAWALKDVSFEVNARSIFRHWIGKLDLAFLIQHRGCKRGKSLGRGQPDFGTGVCICAGMCCACHANHIRRRGAKIFSVALTIEDYARWCDSTGNADTPEQRFRFASSPPKFETGE